MLNLSAPDVQNQVSHLYILQQMDIARQTLPKPVRYNTDKKEKGAGGVGGKMTPCAVLVIQNGHTRLVNIKNQDTITKKQRMQGLERILTETD